MFGMQDCHPHYWKRIQLSQDKDKWGLLQKKIENVVNRLYIEEGTVTSLTGFFVSKEEDNICIAYHARDCGLNKALWVPNFGLPTAESLVRMMDTHLWAEDKDVDEMIHNYFMDIQVRPYTGISLTILDHPNIKGGRLA
eukprot:4579142-Ditylum_brightwellii.AAC.1